jgi:uncharacterized membrane protein
VSSESTSEPEESAAEPESAPETEPAVEPESAPESKPESESKPKSAFKPMSEAKLKPEPEPTAPDRPAPRARGPVLLATALASVLILCAPRSRLLDDPAGLWLMIGAPACVYFGTARRVVSTLDGAALLAVGFALLHDLAVLLALDLIGPLVGDQRPLELLPITVSLTLSTILVGAFVPQGERLRLPPGWSHRRGFAPVLALGALVLLLSVAGPIRLNNGFGSAVSIAAMVVIVALLTLLLFRQGYSIAAVETGIYCAAAGILLLTSLRGWLITGHDIQDEYAYFSQVFASGRWNPGATGNAYYACISVTMLPVAFTHLTAISDVYVFKVVEPLLFATTPVLLFRSVRNVAPHSVAVLSAFLFIIFPTFSVDMTYMSRQEIAFIFVGCIMLAITERDRGLRARRAAFAALTVGVMVSHYSTGYIVIMVGFFAVLADLALRLWSRLRGRSKSRRRSAGTRQRRAPRVAGSDAGMVVPWWLVVFAAATALVWAGPVTHSGGQVQTTVSAALSQLSSNESSGFFAPQQSDAQLLAAYKSSAVSITAKDRARSVYWPLSLVDEYSTPTVGTTYQPLTSLGRKIQSVGVDVTSGNVLLRSLDDRSYELLILVGLFGVWLAGRKLFFAGREQVLLALGALGMLVVLTVVPELSVDYGILRAFEEGMFFFAPFMAAGLIWICGLARRWAKPAVGVGVVGLASTMTGVVPQLTGGYFGILPMANNGQYYDIHYPSTAERSGAQWLNELVQSQKRSTGVAPVVQADYYTYDTMQTVFTGPTIPDILPQWLRPGSYVFVGSTMIRSDEVSNRINGQIVTYRYPTRLLDTEYNKIFASDGAEVFGPEMNN